MTFSFMAMEELCKHSLLSRRAEELNVMERTLQTAHLGRPQRSGSPISQVSIRLNQVVEPDFTLPIPPITPCIEKVNNPPSD
jgi:hypothetical protein